MFDPGAYPERFEGRTVKVTLSSGVVFDAVVSAVGFDGFKFRVLDSTQSLSFVSFRNIDDVAVLS